MLDVDLGIRLKGTNLKITRAEVVKALATIAALATAAWAAMRFH